MTYKNTLLGFLVLSILSCTSKTKETKETAAPETYADITVVGAMKNVMWKGELGATIHLDTISTKKGLYGLGPERFLTGELLINNGKSYVSRVTSDSTMMVEKTFAISAPFFVYATVQEWDTIPLSNTIKTMKDVETFIDSKTTDYKRPFAFTLDGNVTRAKLHVQNLPEGARVSSPDEAHQGQVNYILENEAVDIIGFFSTAHKGVFTHHDSFVHMHIITKDERMMGHLDAVDIEKMVLYLPRK